VYIEKEESKVENVAFWIAKIENIVPYAITFFSLLQTLLSSSSQRNIAKFLHFPFLSLTITT